MKNKKTSLMNILIDFFASLYDLVIVLFAFLYDSVYDFISFLGEYVKWITTTQTKKSIPLSNHAEEQIKVFNQNSIEIH